MIVTQAPADTTCTALVLTDPADTKSLMARCSKLPAAWWVYPGGKYGAGLSGAACPSHINLLLQEIAPTELGKRR